MGLEARCAISWQGNCWTAAVHLDSVALEVRGRPRLVLALTEVRSVSAAAGSVTLATEAGTLTLELGPQAEQWARKIATPPSRGKKLGVARGQRVGLLGLEDAAFEAEVLALGAELVSAGARADLLFLRAEDGSALANLAALRRRIEPDGAIWIVRRKGKAAPVKEGQVREAARGAGLVDVKVAAFSDLLTADKFVVPVAERQGTESRRATTTRPQPTKPAAPRARAKRPTALSRKTRPKARS
jgi:Protein of unknown function (DUF3052)